ncbi:MAG: uroporphyrinogen-III C-methyltransferase [Omnitrophica bacterium RIFCSPHIGHO2_02_FULL_51_18]|nr:MAG: uroporphyrinogen-III C-methyltransferase [Omnitrophica bacterium RIFCSPHIGHO2_02_FULL_51_18]
MTGKVSLVGAGPGDPELLTLKAHHRLKEADLVVYDTLANPEHLKHVKASAKTICVGKRFRYHPYSQRRINRMIIQAARKGQKVVRLKGGDPYLFGRGGEEALYLHHHKVPFEVIPGVTSATACAAYAGIPLTHRKHSASVTFLTGHRAHDENLDSVPWDKIAASKGTLVIYMGFYNLAKIARQLVRAGMSAATKACVIEWGTLPKQRSCDGTLSDIAGKVKKKKLKAPAIIIVGEVVSLKNQLSWYEKLPLFGKKIVVTRTRDKIGALTDKLTELGAEVLEFPTIEIAPLRNFREMDESIRSISRYEWMVFTSTYGVEAFFNRLHGSHKKDARSLKGIRIACVGPETGKWLERYGLRSDLMPERFETSAIVDEFRKQRIPVYGKNFLLVRASAAPPELEQGLKKLGANVTRITGYRTKISKTRPKTIQEVLLRGSVDFVTFTSSSTVDHFVRILRLKNVKRIAKNTRFASIGPVTSKALRSYGLNPRCQAKIFTIDGLVDAIRHSVKKGH